jgi:hypothetical protein
MSDGPQAYQIRWDGGTQSIQYPQNGQWYSIPSGGVPGGILSPGLTTTQRDAVSAPVAGVIILNTTTNKLNFYGTDAAWHAVTSV